ncbi:hypothetical protein [Streptomyces sp. MMG1121]|uniref:hypothetical protein n=1 Tax=Streptomyces sp. MMG1121 TaxID=1415544 RepID=UPI0006ADACCB|nr:hypothetical protein [Streptomyces sp. MMG1121]KOV65456.1 hypothetical protein ADK64_14250 [Streptomyces sp. MMG1121]
MAHDAADAARSRLSALAALVAEADGAPAHRMAQDAALLGRLLTATDSRRTDADAAPDVTADDIGAALSLVDGLRRQLDRLESQVVMEARRRGMDWRQIAGHQGLNSSQAASQRHQRLTTRLEEIRQGVR